MVFLLFTAALKGKPNVIFYFSKKVDVKTVNYTEMRGNTELLRENLI